MFCRPPCLASARRHGRQREAFTLVELMVVVVIIGLLAAAVTLGVRGYLIAGKQNVAKMEISNICQALETFYALHDRYPTNDEGLEMLTQHTERFPDGILPKLPVDPWGHGYQYNSPGSDDLPYEVLSFGADGREGGKGAELDHSSSELIHGDQP